MGEKIMDETAETAVSEETDADAPDRAVVVLQQVPSLQERLVGLRKP